MGNCNNFCEPDPDSEIMRDVAELKGMNRGDLNLSCQLCGQEMEHTRFKNHLDYCHFGIITQKKQEFNVECLICGFKSLSLEGFDSHKKFKHSYLKEQEQTNINKYKENQQISNNSQIKNQIKQIKHQDISILRTKTLSQNQYSASYNSEKYDLITYEKQFSALEFDEEKAKGDVVWRYIFTEHPQCRYYAILHEPLPKTIRCKSYILNKPEE